ncbi:hypothetical protein SteCoe_39497 [Stentor coeruleus]|uniref:Uncharacterized protein n=1 Tax=Stentor coeruleus TaxID=5963 RepID=A0A1R2AKV3_9CILI|nr:hypothetical protein SteCoe_39497 [Stentor coeruleus]
MDEENKKLQTQIKARDEENKEKSTIEHFMGNYEGFSFERIKYSMLELNFEGFENFISNECNFIVQISHTKDQKYLFVCKFLSRLYN